MAGKCKNEVDFCASSRVKIARESDGGLSESEGGGGVDWSLSHRDFCICQPTRPRSAALPQVLPLGKSHLGRRARCRSQRVKLFGLEVNRRKGGQQGGGSDCAKMNWRPSESGGKKVKSDADDDDDRRCPPSRAECSMDGPRSIKPPPDYLVHIICIH